MFKTEGLNELQIVRAEAKAWDRDARASLLEADRILGSTPKWPIHLSTEMAVVVDAAEKALQDRSIYQRAGLLVRVSNDPASGPRWLSRPPRAPMIEAIPVEALQEKLSEVAIWIAGERRIRPPRWVAQTLLARSSWSFPILEAICDAPVLRPDGSLFDRSGYDSETGCLVFLDGPMQEAVERLAEEPTIVDAVAALEVLSDPFRDFPFQADSDHSAVLATILTLIGRHLIAGPVPMFLSRSPVAGTGKSLLFDTIAMIATGRPLSRMMASRSDEEQRKRITSIALSAPTAVLLDNVEHAIGSASLASALTAVEWEDRLLGRQAQIRCPLTTVWLCTGNNLSVKGDLGRRVIPIDLDANVEQPEERGGFLYPNLLEHVRAHRPELIVAALTVLRTFILESPTVPLKPLGSFEDWSDLARACLVWLGQADPCEGMVRIREEGDPEREGLGSLLAVWHQVFNEDAVTARQVVDRLPSEPDLEAAFPPMKGDKATSSALGYYLRRHKGRIIGGLRLEAVDKDRNKIQNWKVVKCG